jgi:hypothetical protein
LLDRISNPRSRNLVRYQQGADVAPQWRRME